MKDMYFGLESHMLYWLVEKKQWNLNEVHSIIINAKKRYVSIVKDLLQQKDISILEKYDLEDDVFLLYYEAWIQKLEYVKEKMKSEYESFRLSIHSLLPQKFVDLLDYFGPSEDVLTCIRFYVYKNVFTVNEERDIVLNFSDEFFNEMEALFRELCSNQQAIDELMLIAKLLISVHFEASYHSLTQNELQRICEPFLFISLQS